MKPHDYYNKFLSTAQKRYEALKAFYCDGFSASDAAAKFNFTSSYFKKLRLEFVKQLQKGIDPFFKKTKPGPKKRSTDHKTIDQIISLRKQNHSIVDIKSILDAKGNKISLNTIDQILKTEGFAPLPKRTRNERNCIILPSKIKAPKTETLEFRDEEFITEFSAGPLIFLPLVEKLGIIKAIQKIKFPKTKEINDVQSILSFLALKLMGGMRWSHDTKWNMDRALGLFANLNVLPKATTLSTYSYRITRAQNRDFLIQLSRIFKEDKESGDFNLDFKSIPHWGEESVLEKNWVGARSKAMKSILSLIVQDPSSGNVSYTNAELKHKDERNAIFDFIDFWKEGRGESPKMLIFDSKFTTYENLNKLNQSKEKIKFLTIRRRSKNLIKKINEIPEEEWKRLYINRSKKRKQKIRIHDGHCFLRNYEGPVRQVILTEHGREKPTFLITNDFNIDVKNIVKKYARRWLVEQEIAEQIVFFNLNNPSSSIVIKVDFDLTLSVLAHNLYRALANNLPGFESCTAATINRKFLENGAKIIIKEKEIIVHLKKKTHLPILFEVPWMNKTNKLSWVNAKIKYVPGVVS